MGAIEYDVFRYSLIVVGVFGIVGNFLVVLSILRQKKKVLKNNYYFLVLHLAICDLLELIFELACSVEDYWLGEPLTVDSTISCHRYVLPEAFQLAGVGMMLIISLLRYRATVQPLKPPVSRRKLKVLCGLVYFCGLIAACVLNFPVCFIKSTMQLVAFRKSYSAFWITFAYLGPTLFMAVVYYKISRSLIKQNKHMNRICSNSMGQHGPDSSFDILRYIRNRRTFFVCVGTVLSCGIAAVSVSVWIMLFIVDEFHLQMKFVWFWSIVAIIRVAGSHSANPFIYGILDKKLLTFWKGSCTKKRKMKESKQTVLV